MEAMNSALESFRMCGRFSLSTPPEIVAKLFDLWLIPRLSPRYNIAPTQSVAVIRAAAGDDGEDSAAKRRSSAQGNRLDLLHWGLIPHWADDRAIGNRMINAKAETAAEKPAFRDAFKKRRCLIPADGFYEWKKLDAAGKVKQPNRIVRPDGQPFALAGLWATSRDPDGNPVESFTILTTEPNAVARPIHNRMPVIIRPSDYAAWLDPAQQDAAKVQSLIKPTPDEELTAYPVSRHVNSPGNDDPRCIAPMTEPAAAEPQEDKKPASQGKDRQSYKHPGSKAAKKPDQSLFD